MISSVIARRLKVSDIKQLLAVSQSSNVNQANVIARRVQPSTEELAELRAFMAQTAVREAEFKRRQDAVEASNNLECHDTNLSNITSLTLEAAITMKGFVEADIEQGADKGRTIYGHYGDQEVNSLPAYLSLLNGYIAEKSGSGTPPSSTPPSAPTETAPPTSGPSPTTPAHTGTATAGTPPPAEPTVGADPNWSDPVGKPGQNHIFLPNVTSLTSETAAAVYKQVSSLVQSRDISDSVIHARNGAAGTYSIDTYMAWLAQRAATNILA